MAREFRHWRRNDPPVLSLLKGTAKQPRSAPRNPATSAPLWRLGIRRKPNKNSSSAGWSTGHPGKGITSG
eukprot:1838346-Heterocapsa_arctica.AAC.1